MALAVDRHGLDIEEGDHVILPEDHPMYPSYDAEVTGDDVVGDMIAVTVSGGIQLLVEPDAVIKHNAPIGYSSGLRMPDDPFPSGVRMPEDYDQR